MYRDRIEKDIDLSDLTTYRTPSRKWRDVICLKFLGRTSTSSARYQDDANPPKGNVDLISLGAVEIQNGEDILTYLKKIAEDGEKAKEVGQIALSL